MPENAVCKEIRLTHGQQMMSSSSGALITSFLMTPFDVVKIRLQSQAKPTAFTQGHCFLYCNGLMDHLCTCVNGISHSKDWYKRPGHFNGTFDAFVKIVRFEGPRSLWSGLPPTLVMAVPATVVYFTSYEHLRNIFNYDPHLATDNWKPMVAGSSARFFASTLISPIEMVRTKMQSKLLSYSQVWSAVCDTVRNRGLLSMWMGLGPTLLRDIPFSALYWTSYEVTKSHYLDLVDKTTLVFYESFLVGAFAGTFAGTLTLPFDVVKTRRQIELGEAELVGNKRLTSTWVLLNNIYRTEGFRVLFTGLLPRILKVAPSCAIMISSFEFFKNYFYRRNYESYKLRKELETDSENNISTEDSKNSSSTADSKNIPDTKIDIPNKTPDSTDDKTSVIKKTDNSKKYSLAM